MRLLVRKLISARTSFLGFAIKLNIGEAGLGASASALPEIATAALQYWGIFLYHISLSGSQCTRWHRHLELLHESAGKWKILL